MIKFRSSWIAPHTRPWISLHLCLCLLPFSLLWVLLTFNSLPSPLHISFCIGSSFLLCFVKATSASSACSFRSVHLVSNSSCTTSLQLLQESVLGRGSSTCDGPGIGMSVACSRTRKKSQSGGSLVSETECNRRCDQNAQLGLGLGKPRGHTQSLGFVWSALGSKWRG